MFTQATSIMETQTHSRLIQAYLTLARFADSQYEILSRQMKTERHEAKRNLLQKSKVCIVVDVAITTICKFCSHHKIRI